MMTTRRTWTMLGGRLVRRARPLAASSAAAIALCGACCVRDAFAQEGGSRALESPRWMYRVDIGVFEPDLDDFATFFGSRRATIYGLGAGYRFRDWLELDAQIGRMRERGVGTAGGGDMLAGDVTYELVPVQLFATFMLYRPDRRLVPYLRIGVASAVYDEEIDLQPSRDGRGDVGPAAGAGLRWRFTSKGSREQRSQGRFWRGYVFLEAQRFSSDGDTEGGGTVDLGGTSFLTGVRVEFELGGG